MYEKSCIPNEWQSEEGRRIHSLLSDDEERDEGVRTGEVVKDVLAGSTIITCCLRPADQCPSCPQTEDNNYIPGLTITVFLHPKSLCVFNTSLNSRLFSPTVTLEKLSLL